MTKPKPKLTREGLAAAMQPPNNCQVKVFLDTLDGESRTVLESALTLDHRELPASAVRDWLTTSGFADEDVPGVDAINNHRNGRRPCRCKG